MDYYSFSIKIWRGNDAMRNKHVQRIAVNAVLLAIVTIMTFVPFVGYIPFFGISITLLHIVLLVVALTMGVVESTLVGLMWGLLCLLKAVVNPTAITDPIFINPLISVLPRVLFGFISGLVFYLIKKHVKEGKIAFMICVICIPFLTLLHTSLVMFFYYLEINFIKMCYSFVPSAYESISFFALMEGVILTNSLSEIAVALIAVPLISGALFKAFPKLNFMYKEGENYAKS